MKNLTLLIALIAVGQVGAAHANALVPAFSPNNLAEASSVCTDGASASTGLGAGTVVGYPATGPNAYLVVCERPDGQGPYTVPYGYAVVPAFSPNNLAEATSVCTDGASASTGLGAGTVVGYPATGTGVFAVVCLRPTQ